jgi:hypothetical protein
MSATIMMPQQIDAAIKEMCSDAMGQAVAVLAEKYGFDADEANRLLSTDDLKIVRKRGPAVSPKAEKPKKADKASKADKPKRAKTGYLLYADEVRAEVKESLIAELEDGEKLKPQDVVKAIAARWGEEDAETKEEWKSKAKTPTTSDDEQEVAELAGMCMPADEKEQDDDQEDDDEATEAAAKVAAKAEEAKAKKEAKAKAKKDAKAQAKKDAE